MVRHNTTRTNAHIYIWFDVIKVLLMLILLVHASVEQ